MKKLFIALAFLLVALNVRSAYVGERAEPDIIDAVEIFGFVGDGVTDNSAAWSNMVATCDTSNGFFKHFFFRDGIYLFTNAPGTQGGFSGNNAQNLLPYVDSTTDKGSQFIVSGSHPPMRFDGSNSSGTRPTNGVIFKTTITNEANFFAINGWTNEAIAWGSSVMYRFRNVNFETPNQSAITALNLANGGACEIEDVSVATTGAPGTLAASGLAPMTNGCGIYGPRKDLANHMIFSRVNIVGYDYGLQVGEHITADFLNIVGCKRGLVLRESNTGNWFGRLCIQSTAYPIMAFATSKNLVIENLYIERANTTSYQTNIADIYDFSNQVYGKINCEIKDNSSSLRNNKLRITGGENIAIAMMNEPNGHLNTGVSSSELSTRGHHETYVQDSAASGGYFSRKARGTTAALTAAQSGDSAAYSVGLYDGTSFQYPISFGGVQNASASTGNTPADFFINTGTNATARARRMTITAAGETTFGKTVTATNGFKVLTSTGPSWTAGTGDPESVVTAPIGSIYSRTDGGAGTTLYVKESGTGNTGWVPK